MAVAKAPMARTILLTRFHHWNTRGSGGFLVRVVCLGDRLERLFVRLDMTPPQSMDSLSVMTTRGVTLVIFLLDV
jgi:hypothetical protein